MAKVWPYTAIMGDRYSTTGFCFFFFFTRTHGTRAFSALKRIETVPEEYYSHDKKGKLVAL